MPSAIHAVDSAFHELIDRGAPIEKVVSGFQFTEGPVFSRIGFLRFSDLPSERILQFTLRLGGRGPTDGQQSVFRQPSNRANGLTFDHQGRLLACETGPGRVTRTEKDGRITVLADRYDGKRLCSPNDLVYMIDGSVYFSDMPRANQQLGPEYTGFPAIYQITPKGQVRLATREPQRGNGVALDPKQMILYAADSALRAIWAFGIGAEGSLSKGRVLAELKSDKPGVPDGLKTDEGGNIYCTGGGGVWVFTPEGKHLGTIEFPETPSNLCWGPGFRGLYITARTSVYHVPTKIPGTRTF